MNLNKPTLASVLVMAVALIFLVLAPETKAATLVVDDDLTCAGATFPTISSAVAVASPGDTIQVCAGTYNELVNVNKQLTILGAQAGVDARSLLRTGLPATESVVNGASGTTSFYVTASDVTIDGFTVQGQTNSNQFGAGIVLGAGTSGADVLNNIVQDNVVGLMLANNSATNQAVIRYNLFRNNNQPGASSGSGIYSDQFVAGGALTNVLIDSNSFTGHTAGGAGQAINLSSTSAGSQSNFTISNNNFDANGRAFVIFNLVNSSITSNTLQNATWAASADVRIFDGVNNLSITCNTLRNGAGHAVRISQFLGSPSSNITINNNNISGYGGNGLDVASGGYSGTLNAESNWWGSPTGPNDLQGRNAGGTGEEILDPDLVVDFVPFRTAPVPDLDNDGILDPCDTSVVVGPPTNKDQCKNGGWQTFNTPRTFKNQGDCIQYVNTGK